MLFCLCVYVWEGKFHLDQFISILGQRKKSGTCNAIQVLITKDGEGKLYYYIRRSFPPWFGIYALLCLSVTNLHCVSGNTVLFHCVVFLSTLYHSIAHIHQITSSSNRATRRFVSFTFNPLLSV